MSHTLKSPSSRRLKPLKERRAPRAAPGSVRWLKGLLGRPIGMEKRGGQTHLALLERRRSPERLQADDVTQLCAELRSRLLNQDHPAALMRHLVLVHDALCRRGWAGVAALASGVLRKAMMQAELLGSHDPSPVLGALIEQLRQLQVAAAVREESRGARTSPDAGGPVEVTESTREEFEAMQRGWTDTESPAADPPGHPS